MTTQQIIALANAGFTAQQIDAFLQAMGANPASMPQPTPQVPTGVAQTAPQAQITPPMQNAQYNASTDEILAQERARQVASMNQAPAVTPQVTIGMGGNAGNASMNPQLLAQYQAQNRYNAGMSIEKPPTMADITDQIINGAVQESLQK